MGGDRLAVEVEFESVEEKNAISKQRLRKLSSSLLNLMVSPSQFYIRRLNSRIDKFPIKSSFSVLVRTQSGSLKPMTETI